jgi:hypothetical protein
VQDAAVLVRLERLASQKAERLLREIEIACRDERLHGVRIREPPRVFHEAGTEAAADARNLSDMPLRVDLGPVVHVLQAPIGNAHSRPLDDGGVVGFLLLEEAAWFLARYVNAPNAALSLVADPAIANVNVAVLSRSTASV